MKVSISSSAIQTYLSQNLSKLKASTSLIISSASPPLPPPTNSSPSKKDVPLSSYQNQISHHIQSVHFNTSQKFNLKAIQYGNQTLTASFPTIENRNQAIELMERSGGGSGDNGTIFGVGSGVAIDLAKACYYCKNKSSGHQNESKLVLVPSTLGAVLASSSSESLMLDLHEEALVTSTPTSIALTGASCSNDNDNVTILIDDKLIAIPNWFNRNNKMPSRNNSRKNIPTVIDAALASIVIAIDSLLILQHTVIDDQELLYRQMDNINNVMIYAFSCLSTITKQMTLDDNVMSRNEFMIDSSIKNDIIVALLHSGKLLSYGTTNDINDTRNMTLALSSAILPKYFPHGNWITFTATLLPGFIEILDKAVEDGYKIEDDDFPLGKVVHETLKFTKGLLHDNDNIGSIIIPSLSSLAEGAPDVNELLQKVDDNGALLNCHDFDSELIQHVLYTSLNR